jgi:hypothetical protein
MNGTDHGPANEVKLGIRHVDAAGVIAFPGVKDGPCEGPPANNWIH